MLERSNEVLNVERVQFIELVLDLLHLLIFEKLHLLVFEKLHFTIATIIKQMPN